MYALVGFAVIPSKYLMFGCCIDKNKAKGRQGSIARQAERVSVESSRVACDECDECERCDECGEVVRGPVRG